MRHTRTLITLLAAALFAGQCHASEKDELALVMRQLDQVQAGLDRARTAASQQQDARFYFDYLQATRDITTMRQGIASFLEPSRAQPSSQAGTVNHIASLRIACMLMFCGMLITGVGWMRAPSELADVNGRTLDILITVTGNTVWPGEPEFRSGVRWHICVPDATDLLWMLKEIDRATSPQMCN